MRKTLALLTFLGLSGCFATVNDSALCDLTAQDAEDLQNGLLAHPETSPAVGDPAVSLLITLSVCEA